jgi:hypothetical protein
MDVFNKIKWTLGVLAVFLIILTTNLIDKKSFLKVEEAVENIYKERLLAKEVLLDISILFHEKELACALSDSSYLVHKNQAMNIQISELLGKFEETAGTKEEKRVLGNLTENNEKLIQLELSTLSKDSLYTDDYTLSFAAINNDIKELSDVQVKEGKNEKLKASAAVATAKLFAKIEIYALIFLGLIIQIIILYKPRRKPVEE